jgi:hypothetical protein
MIRRPNAVGQPSTTMPNPVHALDGGVPPRFHMADRWPAASDVHR